jgi:hypothetical protein
MVVNLWQRLKAMAGLNTVSILKTEGEGFGYG